MTLYEITGQWVKLYDTLTNEEASPEELQAAMQDVDGVEDALAEKAHGYAAVMRNIESEVTALDAEIKRLEKMKRTRVSAMDGLKARVLGAMTAIGVRSLDAGIGKWSMRTSRAVEISDIAALPDDYKVAAEPRPCKTAIKAALERGEDVPGAVLVERDSVSLR